MAKFTRHDPRNKKKNRNKRISLEKLLKIREVRDAKVVYNDKKISTPEDTLGV